MTKDQKIEMNIRIAVQRLIIKAKSGKYNTVWLVKEYHEMIEHYRYYYGICPNDFGLYDRLPEKLQLAISKEV